MRITKVLLLLILAGAGCKPDHKQGSLMIREGDLLFQNLDCGPLCDAIEEVTEGRDSLKFSHIGFVVRFHDSLYVTEAIGSAVQLTPLARFINRSSNKQYVGRLKAEYRHLINPAVDFALRQLGTPYDDPYIYNNGKYYCSELIYDAFKYANGNSDFFVLEPMTFKHPGDTSFFPAWVDYYHSLNTAIPEGEPGINPAGISRSEHLEWLGVIR